MNALSLDDLLGKYAECKECRKLIYILNEHHAQHHIEGGSKDSDDKENTLK
jgi:hypothetical protein